MPENVMRIATTIMTKPKKIFLGRPNAGASLVSHKLVYTTEESAKLSTMRRMVRSGEIIPPCLVFVQSKERAQELFQELLFDGIFVEVIHSDRTKAEREKIMNAFREGKIWFLICTDLMSRGLDLMAVRTVLNYDLPSSAADYVHRIGRTGRAGRRGASFTFFVQDDMPRLSTVAGVLKQSGCEVPDWILKLRKARTSEKKKMIKNPPKRQKISTQPPSEKKRKDSPIET
eukprot:GHVO01043681.1.p1 GENE.GHVO01043681.1~~GHVO01043681.1.p1  ORF type:complete len:270 (+),score=46.50 GHVO01043681.1:121-810(+)